MSTFRHPTIRLCGTTSERVEDDLAVEEPLEIVVDGTPYAVTMRLPGRDEDLAVGFCFTEGIISRFEDIAAVQPCRSGASRIHVDLKHGPCGHQEAFLRRRQFVSTSSCGLCGKSKLEEIPCAARPTRAMTRVGLDDLMGLRHDFKNSQIVFPVTGSTHAAAVFDRSMRLLAAAEDIGRHNALDKAIGRILRQGLEEQAFLGLVTSRLSFEMVQKAGALGLEVLAGFSAATSLAVDLAQELRMTLIGFFKFDRMNVYTHPERLLGV